MLWCHPLVSEGPMWHDEGSFMMITQDIGATVWQSNSDSALDTHMPCWSAGFESCYSGFCWVHCWSYAWEAVESGLNTWAAAIHMRHPGGVLGSWLRPGPIRAIEDTWISGEKNLSQCICLSHRSTIQGKQAQNCVVHCFQLPVGKYKNDRNCVG